MWLRGRSDSSTKKKWKFCQNHAPKEAQNNIPKIPKSHTKKYQNPVFWQVSASPVCWLKTERKIKVHVRKSGIKQPPQFLIALMGQQRGENYISEEFSACQTPDSSRWSLAGSPIPQIPWVAMRITTLFPAPPCPVSATNGRFWTSILESAGIHLGHCLPLKLGFPVLWAKFIPFLLLFPSCSGDGFPTGNIGIITHRSINEVPWIFCYRNAKFCWFFSFLWIFFSSYNNLNY